ncbi:MEDS domain-containing protein [Actinomadura parmotrematis]|uniref:MEDS domain-containing protein n=1 Tax=Actinomadura parmotrematis TaxID=2864039 RepID=A0ABS7FTT9_9ACTN|nr:MEDS domain-containing protein [Actinomadura parmotrematis]MBW8483831.1 MEDS domain-containing protein [Actinomadura parmotrematis]
METLWSVRRSVRDLRPGDHAWLAYVNQEERRHVAGAFVRDGLLAREKVVYLAAPGELIPGVVGLPSADLLTVVTMEHLRTEAGACGDADAAAAMRALAAEIVAAERLGCRAIRVTADMTWAVRGPGGLDRLMACERHIERAVGPSTTVTAVCQFDQAGLTADELASVGATHSVLVTPDPEFEDSVLRIVRTFAPRGLALSGELDASRHMVLSQALAMVMAAGPAHEVHLDLKNLTFIDLGALNMLAEVAAARASGGLILDRMPAQLRTVVDTVGWTTLPGLRIGED